MKHAAKALVVARIKENAKKKRTTWDKPKRGPWDKKVKKADGGDVDKPPFDPSQPYQAADKPPFDPSQPFESADSPDEGSLNALGHGALAGATFNMGDELRGIYAAGRTVPDWIPGAKMMEGAGRLAKNWLVGGDPEALAAYEKARDAERASQASAKQHHPNMYAAGEIGGSLPAMAALPELAPIKGAGLAADLGRGIQAGSEYGALSGAGEGTDATSRLEGAGMGALGGGLGGLAGGLAGGVLSAASNRFVQPVINTVRGWANPEAEAARRLSAALLADEKMIQDGTAKGMTLPQWNAAKAAGEPVTLADLGAGNTQSLLRSAANTSPEGRAMLEKVLDDRFLNQSERVANDVRGLVAGGANANKTADQLVSDYEAGRSPLYKKAFAHPNAQSMYDDTLEQVTQAPVVQQAIRMANITAKNEAAKIGLTPMRQSPFSFDQTGRMTLTDPNVTPNLQYWDAVKKNLDKLGPDGQAWAKVLRDHLDTQVPDYANARGFAANFFGSKDALDAGRTLAGKRVDPEVIKSAMRNMDPDEQNLFREGYASDWANRVINNISDTRDITKAMFNSPNERERALAVFGPAGMAKIEARMALETIMNGAKNAMGNSTTARQLIEAGLAGGALGGVEAYRSGFDPVRTAEAAGVGAGARLGIGKVLGSEMAAGARHLIGKVDATTARNVARMLTSNDPNDLAQGLRMATKNQKIADGLRRIANTIGVSTGAPSGGDAARIMITRMPQGPVPAGAQQEQQ